MYGQIDKKDKTTTSYESTSKSDDLRRSIFSISLGLTLMARWVFTAIAKKYQIIMFVDQRYKNRHELLCI